MIMQIKPFKSNEQNGKWVGVNCMNCNIEKCEIAEAMRVAYLSKSSYLPYTIAARMGRLDDTTAEIWDCPEIERDPVQDPLI